MAHRSRSLPAVRTRAIAYLRVSTEKQTDSGLSMEAQRAKVEAFASLYGLDLVVMEDAAVSAETLERPVLRQILDQLRRGDASALLVVKLDRLTRSVRDLGELLDIAEQEGWAILSVGENLDTRTAAGRLVVNVLGCVAQWEREAIGERTSAALEAKRHRREYCGGATPYGWRLGADGQTLEPNPEEQAIITAARRLRSQPLRAIANALQAQGYLPRTGRWHPGTVKSLLAAEPAA
jgi:DNA invertase Pin-like site-specific DNA recombinase